MTIRLSLRAVAFVVYTLALLGGEPGRDGPLPAGCSPHAARVQ